MDIVKAALIYINKHSREENKQLFHLSMNKTFKAIAILATIVAAIATTITMGLHPNSNIIKEITIIEVLTSMAKEQIILPNFNSLLVVISKIIIITATNRLINPTIE